MFDAGCNVAGRLRVEPDARSRRHALAGFEQPRSRQLVPHNYIVPVETFRIAQCRARSCMRSATAGSCLELIQRPETGFRHPNGGSRPRIPECYCRADMIRSSKSWATLAPASEEETARLIEGLKLTLYRNIQERRPSFQTKRVFPCLFEEIVSRLKTRSDVDLGLLSTKSVY